MTSIQGNHELLDLSYTYNKTDLRATQDPKKLIASPNTLLGRLQKHGGFNYFLFVLKNSGMIKHFGACAARQTLFAVPDEHLLKQFDEEFFINLDHYDALKIIRNHTLDHIITIRDVKTEQVSSLTNLNNDSLLVWVHSDNDIQVDNAKAIDEVNCVNGNIIVIDKLILSNFF